MLAVAFSPDGKTLASGGWDKKIHLWDTASGNELAPLPGHNQDIWGIAFSPNGKYLATGSEDRTARLWDVATGKEVAVFDRHMATYGLSRRMADLPPARGQRRRGTPIGSRKLFTPARCKTASLSLAFRTNPRNR